MCKLVCAFALHMQQSGFLEMRSIISSLIFHKTGERYHKICCVGSFEANNGYILANFRWKLTSTLCMMGNLASFLWTAFFSKLAFPKKIYSEFTFINRGATIRQKAYCDILRYGKPILQYILRYTWYLYFCLLLPLVQYYNIIQGSWNWHLLHTVIFSATPSVPRLLFQ